MKNTTIYDVARDAGLSIKTVSRVMNGDATVKAANRNRILAAAEALGYRPNLSARSLAGARSFVIAAFLDAELTMDHWRGGRNSDYVSRLQLGAMSECRAAGYHFTLELIDHDPDKLRREVRDVLMALRPDGILLTPPSCDNPHVLELLEAAQVRYARLGSDVPISGGLQLHLGDRSGAADVARHLIELGHRRIAIVTGPAEQSSSAERLEGFRQELTAMGLPLDDQLVRVGDYTFASGLEATTSLMRLDAPPTAIFASNDEMALGCLTAIDELGLSCPGDISIAGFDDSGGARFSRPPLTTVRQPLVEMTALAVRRLIDDVAYMQAPMVEDGVCSLVPGNSTGPIIREWRA